MPAAARKQPMKSPAPRPRLYTTDEAAALTGRAAVTIKLRSLRLQAQGKSFGQKIGRQWLYTEDEIRELAAIPAQRGRTSKGTVEKRRAALESVPLHELVNYAVDMPGDGSESGPDPAS